MQIICTQLYDFKYSYVSPIFSEQLEIQVINNNH